MQSSQPTTVARAPSYRPTKRNQNARTTSGGPTDPSNTTTAGGGAIGIWGNCTLITGFTCTLIAPQCIPCIAYPAETGSA